MVTAKCTRCLGSADGSTFAEASSKIDHGVGRSRGKPCGKNFNRVIEVGASPKTETKKPSKPSESKSSPSKSTTKKSATPISEDTKE